LLAKLLIGREYNIVVLKTAREEIGEGISLELNYCLL
jgi:hypothetical protein